MTSLHDPLTVGPRTSTSSQEQDPDDDKPNRSKTLQHRFPLQREAVRGRPMSASHGLIRPPKRGLRENKAQRLRPGAFIVLSAAGNCLALDPDLAASDDKVGNKQTGFSGRECHGVTDVGVFFENLPGIPGFEHDLIMEGNGLRLGGSVGPSQRVNTAVLDLDHRSSIRRIDPARFDMLARAEGGILKVLTVGQVLNGSGGCRCWWSSKE